MLQEIVERKKCYRKVEYRREVESGRNAVGKWGEGQLLQEIEKVRNSLGEWRERERGLLKGRRE